MWNKYINFFYTITYVLFNKNAICVDEVGRICELLWSVEVLLFHGTSSAGFTRKSFLLIHTIICSVVPYG